MDKNTILLLKVDLKSQLQTVRFIHDKLVKRAENLTPEDEILLESVAYQIHNLYGASEELLKVIAQYFENNIDDASQWHSYLLKRMRIDVPGIRPAFLDIETYEILNALRGFRHFFRHAYGAKLDYYQLKSNLEKALQVFPRLENNIQQFISQLPKKSES